MPGRARRRRQLGVGVEQRQVSQDCGRFEHVGAVRQHQRRHLAGGVQFAESRHIGRFPANPDSLVRNRDFLERHLHGQ